MFSFASFAYLFAIENFNFLFSASTNASTAIYYFKKEAVVFYVDTFYQS